MRGKCLLSKARKGPIQPEKVDSTASSWSGSKNVWDSSQLRMSKSKDIVHFRVDNRPRERKGTRWNNHFTSICAKADGNLPKTNSNGDCQSNRKACPTSPNSTLRNSHRPRKGCASSSDFTRFASPLSSEFPIHPQSVWNNSPQNIPPRPTCIRTSPPDCDFCQITWAKTQPESRTAADCLG
jgi:hypothetical protein